MCEQHRDRKWRDSNLCAQLRSNQIILLIILDVLQNHQAIEYKKNVFDDIIHNYKKGLILLDKSRRFWRDDHPNVGTSCVTVGSVPTVLNCQDRYLMNQAQSYLTAVYAAVHEHKHSVIHGAGGMGKSTLAAQYVNEAKENKAHDLIAWINAENEGTLRNSILNVIRKIEAKKRELNPNYVPSRKIDNSDSIIEMKEHLETIIHSFIHFPLFIFDNAPEYRITNEPAKDAPYTNVAPYLFDVGHVIVTTQMNPEDIPNTVHVGCFSVPEAVSYVKKRLKIQNNSQDAHVQKLVEKLGCLPLALSIACGYIKDKKSTKNGTEYRKMNIETFMQEYDSLFKTLVEIPGDCNKSLYTTLQLSVDKLSSEEKKLFYKLCYMAPDNIKPNILGDYGNVVDILWSLTEGNLIRIDDSDDNIITTLSLHRLTQEVGRYIFEQTEEFQNNKQSFFDDTIIMLENEALSIQQSLTLTDISKDQILSLYERAAHLKTSWQTVMNYIKHYQDVRIIDENAYFCRILQNQMADRLLEVDLTQEERTIKEQTQLNNDQYAALMTLYNAHFFSITNSIQKKQICIKLAKFYKGDDKKYVDWSFFENLPYEHLLHRLDILISATEEENFNLEMYFNTVKQHIDAFQSDPYLTLIAVRFKQKRASGTPYVYDEAIHFLKNLCTQNITDRNIHIFKHVLSLWAQLPPHLCILLEKIQKYDENTLGELLKFSSIRLNSLLNLYIDFAIQSVGPMANGLESTLLISNFPSFYQMQQKIDSAFSNLSISIDNDFTPLLKEFPSFIPVITDIYLSFVDQKILPKEENINIPTAMIKVFQKVEGQVAGIVFQGYINYIINFILTLRENPIKNPLYNFVALVKYFPFILDSIGLASSGDGKDDYRLLEEYSKIIALTQNKERIDFIQNKENEYFNVDQTQPDIKVWQVYKIWHVLHKVYHNDEQFKTLWVNFNTIDMKNLKPSEKVFVLEWYFDHSHEHDFIKQSMPVYLNLGYNISDILKFYDFYQKHSLELAEHLLERFSLINALFPSAEDEKYILGLYLPLVSQKRLNTILSHPLLKHPFSLMPFAHWIAMAATMDTLFCESFFQQNPQFSRSTNLWSYWISNPFNMNFYQSYMASIL